MSTKGVNNTYPSPPYRIPEFQMRSWIHSVCWDGADWGLESGGAEKGFLPSQSQWFGKMCCRYQFLLCDCHRCHWALICIPSYSLTHPFNGQSFVPTKVPTLRQALSSELEHCGSRNKSAINCLQGAVSPFGDKDLADDSI